MTTRRQNTRQLRLKDAMLPLVADTRFQVFMEEVAEQQKVAVADATSDAVLGSERKLSVALGEVRAYQSILDLYYAFLEQSESNAEG